MTGPARPAATVIAYRNLPGDRYFHVVLAAGEQVAVRLADDGLAIDRLAGPKDDGGPLFRATLDEATEMAVAFLAGREPTPEKVLDVFLAAVRELGSADAIRRAFAAAAEAARR